MSELKINSRTCSVEKALRDAGLVRFSRGLAIAGLYEDIADAGTTTLLAPVDAAFDGLPWPYEQLVGSRELLEACFDLFEYLVLRGTADAAAPRATHATLHGELVRIGRRLVLGRYGASRVLSTFPVGACTVHVLEMCVFPVFPGEYMVVRSAKDPLRTSA